MIGKELLTKKPVSLSHVKDLLSGRDYTTKESTYEQTQTLDYATKFAKLSKDKAESLFNNLLNLDGMTEDMAVKIVDFLPEDLESMKMLLTKPGSVPDSVLSEALELAKKHAAGS
jgi:DNA-directed RNA polymerase subunit F